MIVVDIETSGVDYVNSGIWQIGAVDLSTKEEFFQESRIDEEDSVSGEALLIIGKTEKQLRDSTKQSQKKLLANFFEWYSKRKNKVFIAQNPQFDLVFLDIKAKKYGLKHHFGYRALDLHTLGALKYMEKNGNFLIEKELSGINLSKIITFCGLKDKRIIIEKGKIIQEGESHNALEDAELEAECFSRLVFGKNLFSKYSVFPIPKELKK
jgi:DNA polymerase III epsilon subunit-like protein